jgi:NADH-quinone oxidoreductase subunit A
MSILLLVPPVALTILVLVVWGLSGASASLGFKRKAPRGDLGLPYAGGENINSHRVQVDYGQFFPFAFFFTILHVVALMVTTAAGAATAGLTAAAFLIAAVYVVGAVVGLVVLYRN